MGGEKASPTQPPADRGGEGLSQPGGRPAAPGELALAQAFINSHYDLDVDHGADLFATPAALGAWLSRHELIEPGLRLDAREHQRALAVREGLRGLAAGNQDLSHPPPATLLMGINEAARGAAVEFRFDPDGARFVAAGGGGFNAALGAVLAIVARAMIAGSWARLKMCPGERCGWVFFDHSRNGSGRWCSMAVCGGRAKARAHYQRRRDGG